MKAQDPLTKNVFNLKGWIVANGIVDFNYDGFVRQAPELYSAFNIIPRYVLDLARKNKCEYYFYGAFPERQNNNPTCESEGARWGRKTEDIDRYDLLQIQKIKLNASLVSAEHAEMKVGQGPFGDAVRMKHSDRIGRAPHPEDAMREVEYLRGFATEDFFGSYLHNQQNSAD